MSWEAIGGKEISMALRKKLAALEAEGMQIKREFEGGSYDARVNYWACMIAASGTRLPNSSGKNF